MAGNGFSQQPGGTATQGHGGLEEGVTYMWLWQPGTVSCCLLLMGGWFCSCTEV